MSHTQSPDDSTGPVPPGSPPDVEPDTSERL